MHQTGPLMVSEKTPVYRVESHAISEAIRIMEQLPIDWQRQALGAIKIIHSQFCEQHQQNSTKRAGQHQARQAGDMTNVILLAEWKKIRLG